jgi:chaperone BCS1
MDVWLNFTNATRWQAEGIFKNFFPCKPSAVDTPAPSTPDSLSLPTTPATEAELGIPKPRTRLIPVLEQEELCALAKRFAEQIPEDELSVSTLSEPFFCPFPRIFY